MSIRQRVAWGVLAAVVAVIALVPVTRADEGMWLINKPPLDMLREKHGFTPSPDWLLTVQRASVRLSDGGSASLVSPEGLIMTNHHVASGQLAKLSTPERDLMETGFLARTHDQELKCPDIEADILWEIRDVSDQVRRATEGKPPAEAGAARRSAVAEIEKQAEAETKLKAQVVTLYGGGMYHLYLYKRFTDVRLVFAPEAAGAYFGGDVDNFEYPRFNLDATFLRIYDGGKPLRPEKFLRFSATGAADGELVFIAGHPGSTQRQLTIDHLRFLRDVQLPATLNSLWRREVQLQQFGWRDAESRRISTEDLQGVQNSRKALTGRLDGLHDPAIIAEKARAERHLRDAVDSNSEFREKWASAWDDIAAARQTYREFYDRHRLLELRRSTLASSDLFRIARHLLRMAEEKPKPSGERLSEYRDSNLPSIELDIFSPAPIYETIEIDRIASGLSQLAETLGADDPVVVTALAGLSPRARAEKAVRGTALKDINFRKKLAAGSADAIAGFGRDPMMALVMALDDDARAVRKRFEDEVEAVERNAYARIAAARFETQGSTTFPDATFTLRLAIGVVKGYEEEGRTIPPFTTFAGLFERAAQRGPAEPFNLAPSWEKAKPKLDLNTHFNFVSTNDIIGGNSGSPVINRDAEVVGLVFDGNRHSLVWDVAFTEVQGRSVSVDVRAILAAMRHIYDAGFLADEIMGVRPTN